MNNVLKIVEDLCEIPGILTTDLPTPAVVVRMEKDLEQWKVAFVNSKNYLEDAEEKQDNLKNDMNEKLKAYRASKHAHDEHVRTRSGPGRKNHEYNRDMVQYSEKEIAVSSFVLRCCLPACLRVCSWTSHSLWLL